MRSCTSPRGTHQSRTTKTRAAHQMNPKTSNLGHRKENHCNSRTVQREAKYINDLPPFYRQLHAAFILTTVGRAKLRKVDTALALSIDGVRGIFTAHHIPGKNAFFTDVEDEEVFTSGEVKYAGQAVGIVVAETLEIARAAAKLVRVEYTDIKKPILNIPDAIQTGENIITGSPVYSEGYKANVTADTVIKGKYATGRQYHFHMETQVCVCEPIEDGLNVHCSTQFLDGMQKAVSQVLKIEESKLNLTARRAGGAFGAKLYRTGQLAAACSLAAYKLNRTVRLPLDLTSNLELVGKRSPYYFSYEVGVDANGKMQYLKIDAYEDKGYSENESTISYITLFVPSCYDVQNVTVVPNKVKTNTPVNCFCRGPGNPETFALMETIMDHIGKTLRKDPLEVRLININAAESRIPAMFAQLRKTSSYDERKASVLKFNQANRWKKKGLSVAFFKLLQHHDPVHYTVQLAVYHNDGTVAIAHGGVDLGQGINTKVVQVCCRTLEIPLSKVQVKPTNVFTNPNGGETGTSVTSELNCYGTLMCCKELLRRLQPIKDKLPKGTSWEKLIETANEDNVDLNVHFYYTTNDPATRSYLVWGVGVFEAEIDILTGELMNIRADVLEDAGKSLNPSVDVGQLEGAFVMGLGLHTMEDAIYDEDTGRLITNSVTSYHAPTTKDIPADFRVTLLQRSRNPLVILGSKAISEPPIGLSCGVLLAIREALFSARKEAGNTSWFRLDSPATVESIQLNALTTPEQFVL